MSVYTLMLVLASSVALVMGKRGRPPRETSRRRNCQGKSGFRSSMLLVPEVITRRNVAAAEPDRIETRCRDDGARAEGSRQSNRSMLRDWSARRAMLIGTLRWAYRVVLQRNNGHPDRYLT